MQKLIIFPFNGNGCEALDCAEGQYEVLGFADDTPEKQDKIFRGYSVFGREIFQKYKEALVLAVPGSPDTYLQRRKIIEGLGIKSNRFARVIHPRANISAHAAVGYNTLVMAGVAITCSAAIGNHVCILPNSVVHHDSVVGDATLIGSNVNISGRTTIGANCYIGSGSRIIHGVSIGDNTLVGLGANVIRSLPANVKAVGNPARIIGKITGNGI